MRRRDLVLGCLIGFTLAFAPVRCAHAQTWRNLTFAYPGCDWHLRRYSSDDFVTLGANQVYAPRWQLEAISIGASAAVAYAVHRLFPVRAVRESAKWSAAIDGIGTGVVPHALGIAEGRYSVVDVPHYAAEVAQRMVPYALTIGDDASPKKQIASYLAAAALAVGGAGCAQR